MGALECLQTLAGHTGPVRTLVYSGGHMFSGSYDKTVRARRPCHGHPGTLSQNRHSPSADPTRTLVYSGGHMVSRLYDKTVRALRPIPP